MRKLAITISLMLSACGSSKGDCTVINNDNGTATVSCEDGSHFLIENGQDGQDGADGSSCTVVDNDNGTATITCPDGTEATVGLSEPDNTVHFHIYTLGANGEIFVDGQFVGTSVNGGFFNAITVAVDGTLEHVISFGEVLGFVTPPSIVVPANTIQTGGGLAFSASYTAICYRSFVDVPCEAWFYDYVEQLVDQGILDMADFFRPGYSLNRAELIKWVVTAIDGLADYEAPATPTFDDVPVTSWFYDYVEAAVQLGIVSGYTDASGNLTGFFGPGDTVSRAFATKVLVNGFAIPTTLSPASPFSDVTPSDWYHDYVLTAYNQSVVDGYENGLFGPGDPVTRAQMAKLIINAQNPVPRP